MVSEKDTNSTGLSGIWVASRHCCCCYCCCSVDVAAGGCCGWSCGRCCCCYCWRQTLERCSVAFQPTEINQLINQSIGSERLKCIQPVIEIQWLVFLPCRCLVFLFVVGGQGLFLANFEETGQGSLLSIQNHLLTLCNEWAIEVYWLKEWLKCIDWRNDWYALIEGMIEMHWLKEWLICIDRRTDWMNDWRSEWKCNGWLMEQQNNLRFYKEVANNGST